MKITGVRTIAYRYELARPIGDVNLPLGVTERVDLAVFIDTDEEVVGTTIGWPAAAGPIAQLEHLLIGRDPRSVRAIWELIFASSFKFGNSGPARLALAAIDCALWDLRAKAHGVPLWKELGGGGDRVRAYASGLDTPLSDAELTAFYSGMADAGVTAGKLKVGRDPDEDLRRLTLMSEALTRNGVKPDLMIDANEFWSPKQAVQRITAIERSFELAWVEEPVHRLDHRGLRRVSDAVLAPIATGENLDDVYDYVPLVTLGVADVIQMGLHNSGITGALHIAELARAFDIPVAMMNCPGRFAAHLAAALPNHTMMEVLDVGRDLVLTSQPPLIDGDIVLGNEPGAGIHFDLAEIEARKVDPRAAQGTLSAVYSRPPDAGMVGNTRARRVRQVLG